MPTLAALDEAMERPGQAVPAVHRLGGGTIAMAREGRPWRVVGSTAVVYQLRQSSGPPLALRCPLADPPDAALADHYRALASTLFAAGRREAMALPLVSDLTYLPEGLSLPGPDFHSLPRPIMVMEWVVGETLLATVDRAARAGDDDALTALATTWLNVCGAMTTRGVSHGDMTGDNALVQPDGRIVLVDYDTLAWPGGPRLPTGQGAPGYRHPSGASPRATERRDEFAALVIYVSLEILALQPDLRRTYGDPPDRRDGVLLFSSRDLDNPDGSSLFEVLREVDQPRVHALVASLTAACRASVDALPALTEIAAARPTAAARSAQESPSVVAARQRQERLTNLNALLLAGADKAAYRFWHASGLADDPDAASDLGPRLEAIARRVGQAEQPPRQVQTAVLPSLPASEQERPQPVPPVDVTARRRAKAADRLHAALAAGDLATVATLWPEVRDDPRSAYLPMQVMDLLSTKFQAAIARAMERRDDVAIVAVVADAEQAGVAVSPVARRAARQAGGRLQARRDLDAALAANDGDALATMALQGRLAELEPLDAGVAQRVRRALAWPRLDRALASDDDAAIIAAHDHQLFEGEELTANQRARIKLAETRLAWLASVRMALRRHDAAALRTAMQTVPAGAGTRLSAVERTRIDRLARRDMAVDHLATVLRAGSDAAILDALNQVAQAGATLPEALDWAAVRGVVDRVTLTDAIRDAADAKPPDYARLARLLSLARTAVAEGDEDLARDVNFVRLDAEVLRAAHAARLRDALLHNNEDAIAAAVDPDPYDSLATLSVEQRARVERLMAARRRR